jgi:Mor family transcriptional regulator
MKRLIARLMLAVFRPALALELDRLQRTVSKGAYLPKESSEIMAVTIEAAYAEYNGRNLHSVCAKHGLTALQLYRYIKDRHAAAASETRGNPPEFPAFGQPNH